MQRREKTVTSEPGSNDVVAGVLRARSKWEPASGREQDLIAWQREQMIKLPLILKAGRAAADLQHETLALARKLEQHRRAEPTWQSIVVRKVNVPKLDAG